MLTKLYVSDTHNPEVASALTMNLEVELSSGTAIARCVDSRHQRPRPRSARFDQVKGAHPHAGRSVPARRGTPGAAPSLACLEHLSLYAPGYVDFVDYVKVLQRYFALRSILQSGTLRWTACTTYETKSLRRSPSCRERVRGSDLARSGQRAWPRRHPQHPEELDAADMPYRYAPCGFSDSNTC